MASLHLDGIRADFNFKIHKRLRMQGATDPTHPDTISMLPRPGEKPKSLGLVQTGLKCMISNLEVRDGHFVSLSLVPVFSRCEFPVLLFDFVGSSLYYWLTLISLISLHPNYN